MNFIKFAPRDSKLAYTGFVIGLMLFFAVIWAGIWSGEIMIQLALLALVVAFVCAGLYVKSAT